MTFPKLPLTASVLTLTLLAGAAQAAGTDPHSCVSITGDAARLSCYDKAMGRTPAPAKVVTPAKPVAKPAAEPAAKATDATPTLPASQTTTAQFGSEQLAEPEGAHHKKKALDKITGVIASHTMTPFGKFTITLTNGQVWKQYQGDSSGRPVMFPHHKDLHVTITRGLFGSYNLTIEGSDLIYKVKRIK